MNKETKISIRNRGTSSVGYTIPDMGNYHRKFAAGERKDLTFEEIQKLAYIPGGEYLLQHFLVIEDLEARDEILGDVELEYVYTEEDVENLIMYGSMDELLDCLDFAPMGVIDLVKSIAVKKELYDTRKCEAIRQKTGFDVSNAIRVNRETNETEEKATGNVRRVKAAETAVAEEQSVRRYSVAKKV